MQDKIGWRNTYRTSLICPAVNISRMMVMIMTMNPYHTLYQAAVG